MGRWVNHHCHSQYSNIATPDVTISNADRIERAVALGHTVASGIEHGTTGNVFEFKGLCEVNGIKPLLGTEAYFVKDRLEKDRTNAHVILLAKNEKGRKGINRILSEANRSGYYYKARVDLKLLDSLPKNDVWVTTACLGGLWKYDDSEEILKIFLDMFGDNLFLEVQYHAPLQQIVLNHEILTLSDKYGIPIIAGMDSHYIYPEDAELRDIYLASRGIVYPDEQSWFLDFPERETIVDRFKQQGVLSSSQIEEAIENTLVFEDVETYTSHIFDKDVIKLPSIYPGKSQETKDKIFTSLIWEKWNEEKENVPKKRWDEYTKEIQSELDVVIETHMADYFLLNYEIIVEAKKNGGMLTLTSRGSAAGFYLSMLMGFTTIDRISSPVKLYPERFISAERILETKSLPDVDFNCGNPEVFADAQDKVLGEGKAYRMITYTTVQTAGAWKMYARFAKVPFEDANKVSEQISVFEKAVLYADEPDDVSIYSYIDEQYWGDYEESRKFVGLVNTMSSHPCAFLLLDKGTIDEEFGLVRLNSGGKPTLCVAIDGHSAEKYLFLKNDWLKATVVEIIHETYKRVGVEPHTVTELMKICDGNEKVWDIYKNKDVMGINQVEVPKTAEKVARYMPQTLSELSAFVAAIRPAFKSNYDEFEKRHFFSYGVKTLDALIQTEDFPYSYLLYQENIMAVLAYAGIPIHETYQVIKSIAKKRHKEVYRYKDIFIPKMKRRLMEDEGSTGEEAQEISDMIWTVIEDAAAYSFNASHSLSVGADSLFGAYLKSTYPLEYYETLLKIYEKNSDKDRIVLAKIEAENSFGIKFPSFQWGQDNRKIVANEDEQSISMSLSIIKGFGDTVAQQLYELQESFSGETFLELLIHASETGMFSKAKWLKLIRVNYFSPFGGSKMLEEFFSEFTSGKSRYGVKLKSKDARVERLVEILDAMEDDTYSMKELLENEVEILGEVKTRLRELSPRVALVLDVNVENYPKYSPKVRMYSLAKGTFINAKLPKQMFRANRIQAGSIIMCVDFSLRNKYRHMGKDNKGKDIFDPIEGVFEWWCEKYFEITDPLENHIK